MKTTRRRFIPAIASVTVLLAGCGGLSAGDLWPFGGGDTELSRVPPNSTAYQCEAGKRFYVRYADNGAFAWIILPEREFRLDKMASASGARFGNGKTTLEVKGDEVTLSDGPTSEHTGCKVPAPVSATPATPATPEAPAAATEKVSK